MKIYKEHIPFKTAQVAIIGAGPIDWNWRRL